MTVLTVDASGFAAYRGIGAIYQQLHFGGILRADTISLYGTALQLLIYFFSFFIRYSYDTLSTLLLFFSTLPYALLYSFSLLSVSYSHHTLYSTLLLFFLHTILLRYDMATRQSIAQKFLDAEETKLLDLVKAILDQDGYLDDEYMASQYAYSKQAIMLAAYHILLATPSVVLRAIIRGDLPAMSGNVEVQYLQDPKYTEVPPRYEFIYPTIYTIYLVDRETHDPPTVEYLLLIIHSIRQVAGPSAIQRPAMETALKLCTELEIRMAGQQLRDPIVGGIVDVGFSGDSAARIDQHLADESSNKIMQIFADAAI
ncbi:hypothetical protein VE01_04080 [Pseudogymnoascus verrucosus]|uniref:Uncharacterized protein n=1 Tax=Pseudogymnoascus verrucosus TaxID=342668 RepID=A0A1B8GM12_9PEZI|nr:uncharacterized protein VE01_04080 [Pseudogymnoascus verrucosus]OBT96828.2 hypothetical protein VE01_04080 [Pseudogymnoascus verrucosus]